MMNTGAGVAGCLRKRRRKRASENDSANELKAAAAVTVAIKPQREKAARARC